MPILPLTREARGLRAALSITFPSHSMYINIHHHMFSVVVVRTLTLILNESSVRAYYNVDKHFVFIDQKTTRFIRIVNTFFEKLKSALYLLHAHALKISSIQHYMFNDRNSFR